MTRAERRKVEQLVKKKQEWGKNLLPWQKEYIQECIDAAKEFSMYNYIDMIDAAVSGALIEQHGFTLDETWKVTQLMGKYMAEIMIEKNRLGEERMLLMKKAEPKCLEMIERLLKEGKKKTEIIKTVRQAFKGDGVTTAEVNIAWKKVSEEFFDTNTDNLTDYILSDESKEPVKGEVAPAVENIPEAVEEVKSKFKIINEVVQVVKREVKGSQGIYTIENNLITYGDNKFNNAEAVDKWIEYENDKIRKEIETLVKKIQEKDRLKEELLEVISEFMEV